MQPLQLNELEIPFKGSLVNLVKRNKVIHIAQEASCFNNMVKVCSCFCQNSADIFKTCSVCSWIVSPTISPVSGDRELDR